MNWRRIKIVTYNDGYISFIPQERNIFLFWENSWSWEWFDRLGVYRKSHGYNLREAAVENFNKWDQYYQKKEKENWGRKVSKAIYEYLS